MKRKPDVMVAVVAVFFVGLIVSGFSSAFSNQKQLGMEAPAEEKRLENVVYTANRN